MHLENIKTSRDKNPVPFLVHGSSPHSFCKQKDFLCLLKLDDFDGTADEMLRCDAGCDVEILYSIPNNSEGRRREEEDFHLKVPL